MLLVLFVAAYFLQTGHWDRRWAHQ